MRALEASIEPSPEAHLAAATPYVQSSSTGIGVLTGLSSAFGTFAKALDNTYVAKMKLDAQNKRNAMLDARYEEAAKQRQRNADRAFEAQKARDEAAAAQRVISNQRLQESLKLQRKTAARLERDARDRREGKRRFRDASNQLNAISPQDGESQTAMYKRALGVIQGAGVEPQQQAQLLSMLQATPAGRAYAQTVAEIKLVEKADAEVNQYAQQLAEIDKRMAEVKAAVEAGDAEAPSALKSLRDTELKIRNKQLAAMSLQNTIMSRNDDVAQHFGQPTKAERAALRKEQEHQAAVAAAQAEQARQQELERQQSSSTGIEQAVMQGASTLSSPSSSHTGADIRGMFEGMGKPDGWDSFVRELSRE